MQPFGPLLELTERLWPTQHQDGEQRDLLVRKRERFIEQVAVLERAAAGAAREPRPTTMRHPVERRLDLTFFVGNDRLAVRRLIACKPQRVQRERIRVRCRALLLDQATENSDLYGIGVHEKERTTRFELATLSLGS